MKPKLILSLALVLVASCLAANAQEKPPPPESPANVLLWPTMDYTNFMEGHPDETRRGQMWKYFLIVEREAKGFAGTPEHWKMLKTVTLGTTGPKWFSNGRLQLGANSQIGTMFHEVFHNTFNGSDFHNGLDNDWSEAFCDAFRYMMKKNTCPIRAANGF